MEYPATAGLAVRRINRLCRDEAGPVWWLHPTNRPRSREEFKRRIRCGLAAAMSDGPYSATAGRDHYVRDLIQGRVIGILEMDFRKMLN